MKNPNINDFFWFIWLRARAFHSYIEINLNLSQPTLIFWPNQTTALLFCNVAVHFTIEIDRPFQWLEGRMKGLGYFYIKHWKRRRMKWRKSVKDREILNIDLPNTKREEKLTCWLIFKLGKKIVLEKLFKITCNER